MRLESARSLKVELKQKGVHMPTAQRRLRQLCHQFDVSRSTLRQALGELEERGLISRHQGRGTFVTRPRLQFPIAGAFSIGEAMRQRGLSITTRVLGVDVIEASRQLATDLACFPGDAVVVIERLRLSDGEPMVLDTAHLRADLFPGLERVDLEHRSLYEVLRTDYIKFARARGLTDRAIHFGHALKNTLVPVITITGLQLGAIIAFAIITETVFQWPGMGLLFIQSVAFADIPVMAAYLCLIALFFVIINLAVDLLYYAVDPRLRIERLATAH